MVKMVADARFAHEGVQLKGGDEFETDLDNAKDLVAIGIAHFKRGPLADVGDGTPHNRRGTYRRRDVKVET
jgi:hypothetical protein